MEKENIMQEDISPRAKRVSMYYAVLITIFFVISIAVVVKIIQTRSGNERMDDIKKQLENNVVLLSAIRGGICADDGTLLAVSQPHYRLRFDFKASTVRENYDQYSDQFASEVSQFFGLSKSKLKAEMNEAFRKGARGFLLSHQLIDYKDLQRFKGLSTMQHDAEGIRKMDQGLIVEREDRRIFPYDDLAIRTIGTTNRGIYGGVHGGVGFVGIEGLEETYLAGTDGMAVKRNYAGIWANKEIMAPKHGMDVITTINLQLQDYVSNALIKQIQTQEAYWGTAVVMEVATGDVKAIANIGRNKKGELVEDYNYAVGYKAEPGSTFKLMSLMAVLEEGKVDTSKVYDTGNGRWRYKGRDVVDDSERKGGYGKLSLKDVFVHSSNIGTVKAVLDTYEGNEEAFVDRLYSFGINKKLDLGFVGEATPYIKYPTDKVWWGTSMAWMSHGYELQLTPLQTLTFYNGVANGGKMVKPRFVTEVRRDGFVERRYETEVLNPSLCSASTLGKLQDMLVEACGSHGTGGGIQKGLPFRIAAKTGTAHFADGEKGYSTNKYLSSFAGYFPADNPKYSMIVVIHTLKKTGLSHYGAGLSGPVFRDVALKLYTMGSVPIAADEDVLSSSCQLATNAFASDLASVAEELKLGKIESKGTSANRAALQLAQGKMKVSAVAGGVDGVPNVVGMACSDALYLLESKGMRVRVSGFGKVKSQSLAAGSKYEIGQVIDLKL